MKGRGVTMAYGCGIRCCLVFLCIAILPFATTTGSVGLRGSLPQFGVSLSSSCSGTQHSAPRSSSSVDRGVLAAMDGTLRISGGGMCLSLPGDNVQRMNQKLMKAAGSGNIERVRLLIHQVSTKPHAQLKKKIDLKLVFTAPVIPGVFRAKSQV